MTVENLQQTLSQLEAELINATQTHRLSAELSLRGRRLMLTKQTFFLLASY